MLPTVKQQKQYGLREREKIHDLHTPNQVPSTTPKRKEKDDNDMYTFTPFGLPKMTVGTTNRLHYNWEKSKGQEYNLRDPVMKPNALPVDDEYLGVLPPETATIAWQHMKSTKKRPSLGDFINIPEPPPVHANATTTETDDAELTETELTSIPQEERADKPDSETEIKDGEVGNRSGGGITSVHNVATGDFTDTTEIPDSIPTGLKELNAPSSPRIPSFTSVETEECETHLVSTMIRRKAGPPFSCRRLPLPSPPPGRRTLVERSSDYKRTVCRPLKPMTCIPPCPCLRSRQNPEPWRICWGCGSVYRKQLPSKNYCRSQQTVSRTCYSSSGYRNHKSCNSARIEGSEIIFKLFPVINVYQQREKEKPKMSAIPKASGDTNPDRKTAEGDSPTVDNIENAKVDYDSSDSDF